MMNCGACGAICNAEFCVRADESWVGKIGMSFKETLIESEEGDSSTDDTDFQREGERSLSTNLCPYIGNH